MRSETSTLGLKRSKREENGIIIHFVFYFLLTVGLLITLIVSIIPTIIEIEKEKTLTKEIFVNIKRIEKEGLGFDEFKSLSDFGEKDRVVVEILENMTKEFFNKNLVNNTNEQYNVFLNKKLKELNSAENIAIIEGQIKQISTILPSYTEQSINIGEDTLTDYKFVNYIESILETFGLSTDSSIGIKNIELIEEYSGSNNEGGSLDSNIYYIPLNMVLKGDKIGIVNFLYFVQNVGNISVSKGEIKLNKDYGFLLKNGNKIILEGEKNILDYNIFSHQMIDVEKILINDYIDSSYKDRGELDLKSFLKKEQASENFEIKVNLVFYVKGQPAYKIEESINNIFNNQKKALGIISTKLKDIKTTENERLKLIKTQSILTQMNKEIISIKKNLVNKEKLDELYKSAIRLNTIIEPIFNSLNKKNDI